MRDHAHICAKLPTVLLALRQPATNARGPLYAEQALAAIHQGNARREPLSLVFAQHAGVAGLFVRCSSRLRPLVEGQLFAQYPDLAIETLPEQTLAPPADTIPFVRRMYLSPYLFPIRRYAQFTDELSRTLADPVTAMFGALATRGDDATSAQIELRIAPARAKQVRRAQRVLRRLKRAFWKRHPTLARWYAVWSLSPRRTRRTAAFLLGRMSRGPAEPTNFDPTSVTGARAHDREDDKQAAADKLGRHCFGCHLTLTVHARPDQRELAEEKLNQLAGALGQFSVPRLATFELSRHSKIPPFLLSAEEVASIWHFPVTEFASPSVATQSARQLEPPHLLPTPRQHTDLAILGETDFRGRHEPFGIRPHDKLRHLALLGKTGQGKTTLLENLILADIRAGHGLIFVDPHGDACELLTNHIPRARTNDVILFDPSDQSHVVSLNLLDCPDPSQRPLVASAVVSAFKKVFAESWGPRLQFLLTNAVLALLHVPDVTLVSIVQMLSDARYRQSVVPRISDPAVRAYWLQEFEPLPARLKAEWTSPVLNKVGAAVTNPVLRSVLGQSRSTLHVRQAMDSRKVILASFSKGRLGDDAAGLLGALFISAVQIAALSRADVPEHQRMPTTLYLDEFHSFATESFATMLSESRKYALACVLATQFLEQVDELTLAAIVGNVGSIVSFAVGQRDAETVAQMLGASVTPDDLLKLPQYQAIVRLLVDGYPSAPFSMRTLPLASADDTAQVADVLKKTSAYRYARPRALLGDPLPVAMATA